MTVQKFIRSILGRGDEKADTKTGSDTISVGEITGSTVAIGTGAKVIKTGKELRDEQYEIALNWDGKRPMREFDLSERDLSGLNLANADLRKTNLKAADLSQANLVKANLSQADLSDTNLKGADLSEADLNGAKYTASTTWPDGFELYEAGAILVDSEGNPIEDSDEEE